MMSHDLLVQMAYSNSCTKGGRLRESWLYVKGQPDIMIMNNRFIYSGCCIEFKSPTNNNKITDEQRKMKKRYQNEGFKFLVSND